MAVRDDFSAGGVATTETGDVVVVVTSNENGGPVLGLPKGHPEHDETALDAALREVREETGLDVVPINGSVYEDTEYWFNTDDGDQVHKRVRFFAMRVVGGDTADHDDEVETVRVLSVAEALAELTYDTERDVVRNLCG
ncbi:MAG: NUDIX domain-containing protein [Acidimicrobiia bacterium]|nr:NUDIX domain-containing protein [Acidimicrobiia bacterium]